MSAKKISVLQHLLSKGYICPTEVNGEALKGSFTCSFCREKVKGGSTSLKYHLTSNKCSSSLEEAQCLPPSRGVASSSCRKIHNPSHSDPYQDNTRLAAYDMDPTVRLRGRVQARVDEALTEWVLDENRPFLLVHSPGLREIFRQLNPNYKTPHRKTVKKRVLHLIILSESSSANATGSAVTRTT